MRRLTLIRHGLTEWSVAGRFQGQSDIPLSDAGRAQAALLAPYVATFPDVDVVVSSTLTRAVETSAIALPGRVPLLEGRLRELHFGAFEGMTKVELERDPRWSVWLADPYLLAPPGGEAYADLRRRADAWLAEAREAHAGAHVVAVTHSGTIQMLFSSLLGVERPRWRKRIYLRHTSVTHVLFRGDEAVVERVNDTRHLVLDGEDPFAE